MKSPSIVIIFKEPSIFLFLTKIRSSPASNLKIIRPLQFLIRSLQALPNAHIHIKFARVMRASRTAVERQSTEDVNKLSVCRESERPPPTVSSLSLGKN